MSTKKTASIILHSRRGRCLVEHILTERGFEVTNYVSPITDYSDFDPLADDIVYFAGGVIGVYQADMYPFLHTEMDIIRKRLEAGKVVIGICLGSQLMAQAMGGKVYKGDQGFEAGWTDINIHEDAKDHPVRHFDSDKTKVMHWHQDTFTVPDNATLLATGDMYQNQIFEYGTHGIAMQFHPEVHPRQIKEWEVAVVSYLTGDNALMTLDDFRADHQKYMGTYNAQTRLFFNEWLDRAGV